MIETFVDYALADDIQVATEIANEVIKRNENAGWNMIQCQLIECKNRLSYSLVFQRTKEVIVKQKFEFGGEHAFKEQSAREIPMGYESQTREEV